MIYITKKMTKSRNDKMITSTMCERTEKPSTLNSEFLKHIGYFYRIHRERESGMEITIKTLRGDIFKVVCESGMMTVSELKSKIFELKKFPVEHQKLIFSGQILTDDSKTIQSVGIEAGSFVVRSTLCISISSYLYVSSLTRSLDHLLNTLTRSDDDRFVW